MTTRPVDDSVRGKRPVLAPLFPAVAVQLIQQMQDPDASASDLARLISLDPSLTASLLRLVNSPFFGMRRQVSNVSDAVMVLGMGAVRRMVLSIAVATPMRKSGIDPAFARTQWQHTVNCAAFARRLIADDPAASEMAFTAGLLHDIGQIHLLQLHGAAYVQMHVEHPSGDLRLQEKERFGEAHDVLGADLLESWGLPQAIADTARYHHTAPPITRLTSVQQAVWVANRLMATPEEAAQVASLYPDTLAPVQQAMHEASAEIEALANLLGGTV